MAQVKTLLEKLRTVQQQTETVANSTLEQPALALLNKDARAPEASITSGLGGMTNEEQTQPSTDERKDLLVTLADLRQAFALSMASIRAYAMTGDDKFVTAFNKNWNIGNVRMAKLEKLQPLFTGGQKTTFGLMKQQLDKLSKTLPEVQKIRGSDDWNLAQSKLNNEVTPTSDAILDILSGKPDDDGQRHGGLVDRQADLAQSKRQPDHRRLAPLDDRDGGARRRRHSGRGGDRLRRDPRLDPADFAPDGGHGPPLRRRSRGRSPGRASEERDGCHGPGA